MIGLDQGGPKSLGGPRTPLHTMPLNKLHFLCLLRQLLWKKCSIGCIFQTIIVILTIVVVILEHVFRRTVPLAVSDSTSNLVDNTYIS